ncbi:unnamed protein product [Dovyalis caffra]|uniref:GDSL esterase/lipase n=1 Tax=Dovyalis caffra TaxID=77055 RepID=A0AAV1RZ16_9ROSI|nr:unnamed protein product [Dovyalis caffra]
MATNSSACSSYEVILGLALVLGAVVHLAEARAFFVFGDSLVDSGNNNYLATTARADAPPYGIDHPTHQPTGRFSNGLNIPDLISEQIGSESPLPYLSPELSGQKLLVGANFASAGIGILNDTGIQFQRVVALIGAEQAKRLVNQALVLLTVGGNDFVNNYYLIPYSARSRQYDLPDYVQYLISEYKKLLMNLYNLGVRRVIVTGTGPLGCVPAELAMRSTNGGCSAELQRAAALYNPQLESMINDVNRKIGSDVFIAANTHQMHTDFVSNPQAFALALARGTIVHQADARDFFVFGDSLVDGGSNNYLATSARAYLPPYGIDYPTCQATGRFSNGLNLPDIMS